MTLTRAVHVFAYAVPVDMRKGFEGLGALVEQQLGRQLLKGDVFLFVGRCRRRAKVLHFDGTGLVLLTDGHGGSAVRSRARGTPHAWR